MYFYTKWIWGYYVLLHCILLCWVEVTNPRDMKQGRRSVVMGAFQVLPPPHQLNTPTTPKHGVVRIGIAKKMLTA